MITRQLQLIMLSALTMLCSCTITIEPPDEPYAGYKTGHKYDLNIALKFDKFCEQKWQVRRSGDTWESPIGRALCMNTVPLARAIFNGVSTLTAKQQAIAFDTDAILAPTLMYFNRTVGATSFGESIIAIKVEWHVYDLNGNTIWVDTVSGQASGTTGWSDKEEVLNEAVEDLFKNSFLSMSSSFELRNFASTRRLP